MNKVFVPYNNDSPAAIDIKGHRLLILAANSADIEQDLSFIGASEVREYEVIDDTDQALAELAVLANSGVVLTPPGVNVQAMIESLREELPWVH